jgi:hypothetical protein
MSNEATMRPLCDGYIRRFAAMFALIPFRSVYVLRLVLSLALGVPLAAYANWLGLQLWLIKHRSPQGPATVLDGVLVGVACGMGTALVPPLTALIASHHWEDAKTSVIVMWLVAWAIGGILGGTWASIGRRLLKSGAAPGGK